MLGPAAALVEEVDIEIVESLPMLANSYTGEIVGVKDVEADLIVLQRPLHYSVVDSIPFYQKKGIAIAVEIDDDLSALSTTNVNYRYYSPAINKESNWKHLKRACGMADLVICSTPALAERYGSHGRVAVVPNAVPESYLTIKAERDGRTIGWGGITHTHGDDLQVTRGGVGQAVTDEGARFKVVGDGIGVKKNLSLADEPEATGLVPFAEYIEHIATLDVTIAPLADTKFNAGKSWLKALEAASAGVPCVASPRPEYEKLAKEGICVLAPDRARNWRARVSELLRDESLRHERAQRAHEAVREAHTIEGQAWRWMEAWTLAIGYAAKRSNSASSATPSTIQ